MELTFLMNWQNNFPSSFDRVMTFDKDKLNKFEKTNTKNFPFGLFFSHSTLFFSFIKRKNGKKREEL